MTEAEIAEDRVRGLAGADGLAKALGIEFVAGGPGTVTLAMTVTDDHLNFFGKGHGGAIFALADAAFGLASNSHGRDAIGIDAHIAYVGGVEKGTRLTAVATEVSRANRVAVYRIEVKGENDTAVATFTGTVYIPNRSA